MKKTLGFISLSAVLLLSSCVTTVKTARTAETSSSIKNATVADLRVTDHRVTYTMTPTKEIQRAGLNNVKQAALQEALTKNGNADVMVEPEYVISMKNKFLLGKEVTSVTVTGRPAYYENFRTLNDSVWATPGFYGKPNVVYADAPKAANGFGDYAPKATGLAAVGNMISGLFGGRSNRSYDASSVRRTGLGFDLNVMEGSLAMKFKDDYDEDTHHSSYTGVLGTIGLQANPWWWFGIGSGVIGDNDDGVLLVPLYGNIRAYFSKSKNSFFYDFKLGGTFEAGESDIDGGVFVSNAIGYSFGAFEIAFQVMNQAYDFDDHGYYYSNEPKLNSTHIGVMLGLKF